MFIRINVSIKLKMSNVKVLISNVHTLVNKMLQQNNLQVRGKTTQ